MSASQSNLSDPAYGYDLVIAVTQASINVTMEEMLADVTEPEVISCWVSDATGALVAIDYETLKSDAHGSDPFAVPDGADPKTNQDLINLASVNFAGAFKASIGLPNVPIANLPPVVTLGTGTTAPVVFNLLCSEFQIVGFSGTSWINLSQPTTGTPWYFSANVALDNGVVDAKTTTTAAVSKRAADLTKAVGADAFTIQALFLDLDTAIVKAAPTIVGIPTDWPVWTLINDVFLGAYFGQLAESGKPALAYAFKMKKPAPSTMELGALAYECCPLLDADGKPIVNPTPAQQDAATLVYIGTESTTAPVPVPFSWNWVELGDVTSFSGTAAVRRDVFFDFLVGLANRDVGPLCIATSVSMTHKHDTYTISYAAKTSGDAAAWESISPVDQPNGFTNLYSLAFKHDAHDSDEDESGTSSIHGKFDYSLAGTLGAGGVNGNQIRIDITAKGYMSFGHHELGVHYHDLPGADYYDKTVTVLYTLDVDQSGKLCVSQGGTLVDNSATWDFKAEGIIGIAGHEKDVKKGLTDLEASLATTIDRAFTSYAKNLTDEINGYRGWVFPGADAFVTRHPTFSASLDLVTELTYANPD